jgi:hypothetical protein
LIFGTALHIRSLSLKRLDGGDQHHGDFLRVLGGVSAVFSNYLMMAMNRVLPRDAQVHLLIIRAFELSSKSADGEQRLAIKHDYDGRTDEI